MIAHRSAGGGGRVGIASAAVPLPPAAPEFGGELAVCGEHSAELGGGAAGERRLRSSRRRRSPIQALDVERPDFSP
jgi:hypothetical protein